MDAIRIEKLEKHFGHVRALDGVDLVVPKGSTFGLIGPNGAGKTTLMGLVCGWLRPTRGEIKVLDHSPWRAVHLKGRISAFPQDAALPPNTSVVHSLTYFGRLQGLPRERAKAEAGRVLDLAGLSEWGGARASTLSHGMAKRIGLAQAFIGEPELILLDEPTAGLDPKSAHHVRSIVEGLKERATVLISSHNLNELEKLCDHAAILDHGKLLAGGTMAELTSTDTEVVVTLGGPAASMEGLEATAQAVNGVTTASLDAPRRQLTIRFATGGEPAEEIVTRVLSAIITAGGKIGAVSRGQSLEQRVLSVT